MEHIGCRYCRFFYVTWDRRAPYGCRVLGFKSRKLPSLVVFEASGVHCQMFVSKKRKHKGNDLSLLDL